MKLLNELKSNENTIQQSKLGRDVEAEQNRTEVAEEMTVDFSSGKCSEGRFERSIGPSEADSNKRTDSWSGTDSISSANKSSFRARSIFE